MRQQTFLLLISWALLFFVLFSFDVAESSELEQTIRVIASQEGVDSDLAVAIAQVESGMNPNKVGAIGEVGLFQLRPEYHRIGTVQQNIRTAMKYLNELKRYCGPTYGEAFFICYNVGPNYEKRILFPKKFPYYVKVMSQMNRIAKGTK